MTRIALLSVVLSLLLGACGQGDPDVVIVSKAVRSSAVVSAGVPDEFGGAAGATRELYWIEGELKNPASLGAVAATAELDGGRPPALLGTVG